MMKLWLGVWLFASVLHADNPLVDAGDPFGKLPLVDEVICGDPQDPHPFRESAARASRIEKIMGQRARVVTPARKPGYFAYKIGAGRELVARHAYLLQIDYPEDEPRTLFVVNRGAETAHGIHTGATLGDALWTGDNGTAESLSRIPLAKSWRSTRTLFFLQDHTADLVLDSRVPRRPLTPADGFWVAILHPARTDEPLSHGAAAARIRLFDAPDITSLSQDIRYPPEGLPRRHLVLHGEPGEPAVDGLPEPGMDNMEAWFESQAQQLRFLGVNTWCMTLLASGRNAGWEAENDEWFAPAADPLRWEKQLQMVERYGLEVLPYFEYGGSLSLNAAAPVRTLRRPAGKPYTNVAGGEPFHLDATDPRSLEDVRALLDHTIVRYKDQVRFVGAWFRTRVAQMPVSFSDAALMRFATEANGGSAVTRQQVAADPGLRARYGEWWLGQRRAFFAGVRDYLRQKVGAGQRTLFTPWAMAGGPSLPGRPGLVVTDDPGPWADGALDNGRGSTGRIARLATVVQEGRYAKAASAWRPGVGEFEWTYALPRADSERWGGQPGLSLTYPFNHQYSVDDPAAFADFQGSEGVAAIRFQPRNDGIDGGMLGGIAADTERAGPFCLLEEAHAVANGDPVLLGSLAVGAGVRAFPEYVRRFNAAYLALPALSSSPLADACDDREVVVRVIRTEGKGTWLAVVNTGLVAKPGAVIRLPEGGPVLDAATGADLAALTGSTGEGGHKVVTLRLPLDPCELRAVLVQPKKE